MKYYLDTCIWRDFYEDRFGQRGKPLGRYASLLIMKIIKERDKVVFSDIILDELKTFLNNAEIGEMLTLLFLSGLVQKTKMEKEDGLKAREIARLRKVPFGDALNAVLASKSKAILVTRDKHFGRLRDVCMVRKPEDLV